MTGLGSIRFRVVAAFVLAAAAMLLAMGFQATQARRVSERHALITEGYLPIAHDIDALSLYQERVDNDIARLLQQQRRPGVGAASSAAIYTDKLRMNIDEARVHVARAQTLARDARDQAVLRKVGTQLDQVEALFERWDNLSREVVTLLEQGRRDEASERLGPLKLDAERLAVEIETLSSQVGGRIGALAHEADAMRARADVITALLAALGLAVSAGGIAAVLVALRPIAELTTQVQRLAAGDYSGAVRVSGSDEVAVLAAEFNAMVGALRLRDRTLVERAQQLDVLTRYLGSVLDSLEDGLFVVEDGRVTRANPAAKATWDACEDGPVPPALAPAVARPGRREIRAPDGSLHEVRVARFGERGAIVVSADVTEQKRAQDRLARSERLALIGQMLAQITHEVRNPLNALSLNAELLSDELAALDPDRTTEAWAVLATVSGEIERLTRVTEHYLALARRPRARLGPVDFGALVDDVIRLLKAELDQRGVRLEVRREPFGPCLADGNQVRQAILNVVRNATEAGATALELTLSATPDAVRITLRDDGPGMSAEEVERASDPFFSTKPAGTGLGLAITRQILEDHGGALEVHSAPGEGTRITLILPRHPAPPPAPEPHPAEAP